MLDDSGKSPPLATSLHFPLLLLFVISASSESCPLFRPWLEESLSTTFSPSTISSSSSSSVSG
ncbi:unnamed protein product [Schistosoma mattheei]|uniref:Secreted protein n=1 Tax=Schistosoma mattheei TaxID=31246 RepID=A0A3P8E7E5_9TREM|nr:unnamed protein product [Schistosoma mattheei]